MMQTGRSLSNFFVSLPSVRNLENSSTAWCFSPAQRNTSNSYLDRCSRQAASLPAASEGLMNHFRQSWSVLIVILAPFKCGGRSKTSHTMSKHSRWVVLHTGSALVSERDQYPSISLSHGVLSGVVLTRLVRRSHLYQELIASWGRVVLKPAEKSSFAADSSSPRAFCLLLPSWTASLFEVYHCEKSYLWPNSVRIVGKRWTIQGMISDPAHVLVLLLP